MANKGKNTNSSQLYRPCVHPADSSFITYRPVPHLNQKHTIFGKVVGGMDVLDRLEDVPSDHDEKPIRDIKINKIIVFVNPFDVSGKVWLDR
jgi:peptidyl-prolyl cis-trans isomerase-like 2